MYPGGGNSGGFGCPPGAGGHPPPNQQPYGFNAPTGNVNKFVCILAYQQFFFAVDLFTNQTHLICRNDSCVT